MGAGGDGGDGGHDELRRLGAAEAEVVTVTEAGGGKEQAEGADEEGEGEGEGEGEWAEEEAKDGGEGEDGGDEDEELRRVAEGDAEVEAEVRRLHVGVLELQGAFAEHTAMVRRLGVRRVSGVRAAEDLAQPLDALILPGGESTTMEKLLRELALLAPLRRLLARGLPVLGTCAGLILLARALAPALDVRVRRNAYGRQLQSCDAPLTHCHRALLAAGGGARAAHPRALLIRAPAIERVGAGVQVLARVRGRAALVRQRNVLACSFHPELTDDPRVHRLFLRMAAAERLRARAP